MKIEADYALLDVKKGRQRLFKAFTSTTTKKIPVCIHGFITEPFGEKDGISRQFLLEISSLQVTTESETTTINRVGGGKL